MALVNSLKNFFETEINVSDISFREKWKKCADFGLFGLTIDSQYGGLGENYSTMALLIETLGYCCNDNGFVFAINNHLWACQNIINLYGNEEIKSKYLKKLIDGTYIGAFALTETESGSDAFKMQTVFSQTDKGILINGQKTFISNGNIADIFVLCGIAKKNNSSYTSCVVVEKGTKGFTVGEEISKMGLDSCSMSSLYFDNCLVPKQNIIGQIGLGTYIINQALEWERSFEFASHIGSMKAIMETCLKYCSKRVLFGQSIDSFDSISFRISEMKMNIELSELLLFKIAFLKDENKSAFLESSIFKLFVSESYVKACLDALQIFGAYGYTKDSGIEQQVRDSLSSTIYSGTSEIQKKIIFELTKNQIKIRGL